MTTAKALAAAAASSSLRASRNFAAATGCAPRRFLGSAGRGGGLARSAGCSLPGQSHGESVEAAAASARRFSSVHSRPAAGKNKAVAVDFAKILDSKRQVQIHWKDGHISLFNFTWLRVNCPSAQHPSGQRMVFPKDIPRDLVPTQVKGTADSLKVTWTDGHVSTFDSRWLRSHDSAVSTLIQQNYASWPSALRSWDGLPKVACADYMASEHGVFELLRAVNKHGLALLEGCGTEPGTCKKLAERVSPVSHGFLYGDIFDVISQENSRNIAYTAERLRPHMDLAYYESPPGLQTLHCLRFDSSVKGGETTFIDGFEAARMFKQQHPEDFAVLSSITATFKKIREAVPPESDDGGVDAAGRKESGEHAQYNAAADSSAHMVFHQRHIITTPQDQEVVGIYWAPQFEGALRCAPADAERYYAAHAKFTEMVEDSPFAKEYTVKVRLQPGQAVVYNNRRMLHGREAFSGAGVRHLQGCYTNIDEYLSRYIVLSKEFASDKDRVIKRVGNKSQPAVM